MCACIACEVGGLVLVTWFYGRPDTDSGMEWCAPQNYITLTLAEEGGRSEITCNIEEIYLTTWCIQAGLASE